MASTSQIAAAQRSRAPTAPGGLLDRYFYFAMSLVAAAAVVAGFGETVDEKLFHPPVTPPRILWLHGAVFSSWIVFFILQSALVRTRNVKWHRLLGWVGTGLVALMVPLGVATAVAMVRFETYRLHESGRYAFLAIPFFDIGVFALCAVLAIAWRKKPEFHRRLIFFATCALLVAAFARMDHAILRVHSLQYLGPDLLLALGVGRDLLVNQRIHKVYRVGLPAYLVAQLLVIYLWRVGPEWWLHFTHAIAG
jgi:FtsH-binding integral membrane protein